MGKGTGCIPSKGSKFLGGGSGAPHEKLETGPSSDAKFPGNNEVPAPAARAAPVATPAVAKASAPVVANSAPAPPIEVSADNDVPVKTFESTATPVTSAKVKVFIV